MSSTGGPAPRLRTRRATPDDAGAIARIHFEAFGPGVMNRLMHPNGVSEDARAKFAGAVFPPPDKAADPSAEVIVMVAELLPEASEAGGGAHGPAIVAFAKWKLVRVAQPREEWEGHGEMTEGQLGEGADAAVYNEFIGGLHRMRQRWVKGDPCLHLGILATTPTRHGLGAGSALLKWGCELADRENKTAWLEASPAGYSLYRRFGFEDVEVQDLKLTELWGPVGDDEEVA
ncbi:putative n-acetyltransferase-like protein [Diaporthe ampelina]|uniref:Putative n-acetyltransferase-like protein n=1 Tax=Diaporthe ampelina TaxID=1214573 RepID=A0A0G2F792_9PEZI|nr:putative n-acetyltransferase-like protein [Diaporthe ampelina]